MIKFDNWVLTSTSRSLDGYQYDNLTVELEVIGDFPAGWDWKMLVQFEDNIDILPLTSTDNGITCVLNKDNLCFDGCYSFQLQGIQGDLIKHTNIIYLYLPKSISGDAKWPTVPTEFTDLERRLLTLNGHPPILGEDGNWLVWNAEAGEYVDTGVSAQLEWQDEDLLLAMKEAGIVDPVASVEGALYTDGDGKVYIL